MPPCFLKYIMLHIIVQFINSTMQVHRLEMAKGYYAVYVGRVPGVYDHWPAAQAQVHRYPGTSLKGFDTRVEAESSYLRWTLQHEQGRDRWYYIFALFPMLITLLFYIML